MHIYVDLHVVPSNPHLSSSALKKYFSKNLTLELTSEVQFLNQAVWMYWQHFNNSRVSHMIMASLISIHLGASTVPARSAEGALWLWAFQFSFICCSAGGGALIWANSSFSSAGNFT